MEKPVASRLPAPDESRRCADRQRLSFRDQHAPRPPALGVRADGQKVLLAVKNMGGESEAAWRALLDDLVNRGLKTPELIIGDGAPGLERALAALWPNCSAATLYGPQA